MSINNITNRILNFFLSSTPSGIRSHILWIHSLQSLHSATSLSQILFSDFFQSILRLQKTLIFTDLVAVCNIGKFSLQKILSNCLQLNNVNGASLLFLDLKKHLVSLLFCSRYKSKIQQHKSYSQYHLTVAVLAKNSLWSSQLRSLRWSYLFFLYAPQFNH